MALSEAEGAVGATSGDTLLRHAGVDRLFHWLTAAAVLTLLATAFLPILGVDFDWVPIHWVAGIVLGVLVLLHAVRAVFWQRLGIIWFGRADLADLRDTTLWNLRASARAPAKPGKYSPAQKLTHWLFTLLLLTALVSGSLMLTKIDTAWWRRNPYWLGDRSWGLVYVAHDLAALCLISVVMVHVYFALRPEKWFFTRSMLFGRITRREYSEHHDAARWQP